MLLINSLKENRDSDNYPFHMPGHKRRLADDELLEKIYGIDITEIPCFDDLHDPDGIIKEAEQRAAKCYGADETYFLVNGSTGGILAAICGSATKGDTVIYASNCHRSVTNAVMLSGADVITVDPDRESLFDIFGGVSAAAVSRALDKATGKRTAVVITSPTYEGITSDVEKIAGICRERGAVLIVDAAHGAHLGFSDRFPKSAVGSADVVITSVHKTLPAMTQTALIHISESCPSKQRIRKMLSVFMTSSPSYVLMSSIDSLSELLETRGRKLFEEYEKRLDDLYKTAEGFSCLSVLNKDKLTAEGSADHDMGKIVVSDMTSTFTGKQLADMLLNEYGLCPEMASGSYVLLMTGIADTNEGFERLKNSLLAIDKAIASEQIFPKTRGVIRKLWDAAVGRRIARSLSRIPMEEADEGSGISCFENNILETLFTDDIEYIPVELSEGRIAANTVLIYPPGIPVTVPGRVIDGSSVDSLLNALKYDLKVSGLCEGKIAVIWERSSI